MDSQLNIYERKLLDSWEDIYKKGQLTLWVFLALKNGPKHMDKIKKFIDTHTNGTLKVDDKSMYRALRRYNDALLIKFRSVPSNSGPDLKIYSLTKVGERVLEEFLKRNIKDVFLKNIFKELIK